MDRYLEAALVLMLSAIAVFLVGVASEARVCYSGPPPEPDPDNPDDWMKQVMQEIRERCPGRKEPTPAGHTTPASHTTPVGHTTMGKQSTPASHTTMGKETTLAAECLSPEPLGMEDWTIPNDRITASSTFYTFYAWQGRLRNTDKWMPQSDDANPWIEIDLVDSAVVSGLITQGWNDWYMEAYRVEYKKQSSSDFEDVTDRNGNIEMFGGNTNYNTWETYMFDKSVVATVVRIVPTQWSSNGVGLRMEILGCRLN